MTLRPIYADPALISDDSPRPPEIVGHFKTEALTFSCDDRDIGGNGSGGTGRGSGVARTARGRWLRLAWSNWSNEVHQTYYDATPQQVQDWLLANGEQGLLARWFPDLPDEDDRRRPVGRPPIDGDYVSFKPGAILPGLDAWAGERGLSRSEAIRRLLGEALAADRPYTVSSVEISTGLRSTDTRYRTLGAAVDALRVAQEYDYDNQQHGLPSSWPRVEHDGRPVDVEAPDGA